MIFIVVKFKVKPEWADRWVEFSKEFTEATRAEPGNLWFDWSRSVDDPNEFVLLQDRLFASFNNVDSELLAVSTATVIAASVAG